VRRSRETDDVVQVGALTIDRKAQRIFIRSEPLDLPRGSSRCCGS